MSGDIDQVLEEGFDSEADDPGEVGDPDEDPEDFLSRVENHMNNFYNQSFVSEEELLTIEDIEKDPDLLEEILEKEELRRRERENSSDFEDDLDIFEVEGDDE